MEGNTNWKPNEQGRDSGVNNANDWRSQHEPDMRQKVLTNLVVWLKKMFPKHSQNDLNKTALIFEDKTYSMATDKNDYIRKLADRIAIMNKKAKDLQSGSSVNAANTTDPAQVVDQGQSLPTSLPYTQTSTSQQWLTQNIQSNLDIPGSSVLPTQVNINVSAGQNVNIQMGEGVHSNLLPGSQRQMQGRQQLLPQQQQPQNSNYMSQDQMNQKLLKENVRQGNLRPPYMQQQVQQQNLPQSLSKQPIHQELPHQTSLSTIQQSFPQSSALSSLSSSGQQNSQFLPRPQFPTQRVRSSHPHQIAQEQLINQLMYSPDTQQNHLTTGKNNGEQQGAFRVSSSHQNNIANFQPMAQQNNNLQNMHQQRLSSHSNNASALPSQQQQNTLSRQSGNFNVPGSSLLGTQDQKVGQSQPMMYQMPHPVQQQQQNRTLQQHLDDTQRFQAAGSLRQTQNIADQQNQPYQLQRAAPTNPSTSQDSTGKTVNANGGYWQEETYHKIKALKEMYIPVLSTMHQKVVDKLRKLDSLPQQKLLYEEETEKLWRGKSMLELLIVFLNVHRSGVSEKHRDKFSLFEEQVLRITKYQTGPRGPVQQQQQQGQFPPSQGPQVNVSQSLENDQMMHNNQNGASSLVSGLTTSQTVIPHSLQTRPKMEPRDEKNIMASSGNVVLPSLKKNPPVVHSNISSVQSGMIPQQQKQKQTHHRQIQQQLPHRQQQQQQPLQQQANPQLQMSRQTNEMTDMRSMKPGIHIKADFLQKHLSSNPRPLPKPLASSAQIQNHSSPQLVDQQILPATLNKTGTPSQSGGSPFVAPSPMTSFAPSPVPGGPEKLISVESPVLHSSFDAAIKSIIDPPFTLPPEPMAEQPIDRLIKAFQSSSPKSLAESVSEMSSVISMTDRIAGSFHFSGGSRACLAEDLSARTKFRLQARNLTTDVEPNPTKRMKRSINTLPLDIASLTDSYKQFSSLESEDDSTASSGSKINKIEPGFALLQEINEINGRLVETVVNICGEDTYPSEVTSGKIVTCSYSPVAFSATFEAHYKSGQLSQIEPLHLLVPANYPYSSPILLENIPFDASVHKYEDLSARTRSRFSLCVKELSEPMSLKEIAQMWNDCARATMTEYAERHGGGTFSSKFGSWETVLRAS